MADKSWYYTKSGRPPAGPVSARELRTMAADGRLDRSDLLSRTSDGRQVRADSLAGLFAADAPTVPPGDDFGQILAERVPIGRAGRRKPDDDRNDLQASRGRTGGLFDLSFSRFVTPSLIKFLWGVWLFGAVPLLTLAILAQPVVVLVNAVGSSDRDAQQGADNPEAWPKARPAQPRPAANSSGPSAQVVALSVGSALAMLIGLALQTLVVRVLLESTVVLFRGAEAVMAIDQRQRRDD